MALWGSASHSNASSAWRRCTFRCLRSISNSESAKWINESQKRGVSSKTSVEKGAVKAATELDVEVIWKGPLRENDRAQQIELVQRFVAEGVDGIALAPLDHRALVKAVQEAHNAGIPVVIFDSALDGTHRNGDGS